MSGAEWIPLAGISGGIAVAVQGLALGSGLIVAIGAQNAFVLRQGLRREHVGPVVAFCASADAALIVAGVFGMAQVLGERPWLATMLTVAGCVFLGWYGWLALRRALRPQALTAAADEGRAALGMVMAQTAAFTLLNPHVYLDTVLLVGSIGAQHPPTLRPWFAGGASLASVLWFVSIGYGARWLAPWLGSPRAWRVLDGVIGATMWALMLLLARRLFAGG